jgi:hypothetical protein
MAGDLFIMIQIEFSVWEYSWNSMHHYVYIIMLLESRIFGVVFTIIWLPKCFWCYKHILINVWKLLLPSMILLFNMFSEMKIQLWTIWHNEHQVFDRIKKNCMFWKNGCSGLPFWMFQFVAEVQCYSLLCWTEFSTTGCSGIRNQRVQYFKRFGWFGWNNDNQTCGLEDTPGMLFREPWSCYWYKSSVANFEVRFSWSRPLSPNYRWFAIEMLGFGSI